jgi:hypothetical protein
LALRYEVRVRGEVRNELEISPIEVSDRTLRMTLANTGNTRLTPIIAFKGESAAGVELSAPPIRVGQIEPGSRQQVVRNLSDVPKSLTATIESAAGTETRVWPAPAIGAVVVTPGAILPPVPNAGSDDAFTAAAGGLAAFIVILVLIAVVGGVRRRRARERKRRDAARRELARRRAAAAAAAAAAPPPLPPGFAPTGPPPPTPPVSPSGSTVTGSASGTYISGT